MDDPKTAAIIAIISAGISLSALLWQLLLFKLSGPRLRVTLAPVVVDVTDRWVQGNESGWQERQLPYIEKILTQWRMDVAKVTVLNKGRSAVTVSNIGLDLGPDPWYRPWSRFTVSLEPVDIIDGVVEKAHRLEPGSHVSYYFYAWRPIRSRLEEVDRSAVTVRGTLTVAGTRVKRSPWRRRWHIDRSDWRLRQARPLEHLGAEIEAFEELWMRLGYNESLREIGSRVWRVIEPLMHDESVDDRELVDHVHNALQQQHLLPAVHQEVNESVTLAVLNAREMYRRYAQAAGSVRPDLSREHR